LPQTPVKQSSVMQNPVAKAGIFDTYMKDPKISKQ
jgi:hypothetical protein